MKIEIIIWIIIITTYKSTIIYHKKNHQLVMSNIIDNGGEDGIRTRVTINS